MDPKQVNVLDLPKRPNFVEPPIEDFSRFAAVPTLSDVSDVNDVENEVDVTNSTRRRRRQSGVVIMPEAITDNEGRTRQVVTLVFSLISSLFFLALWLQNCSKTALKLL